MIYIYGYVGTLVIQQMRNIRKSEQLLKIYRIFIAKSRSTYTYYTNLQLK